ncbi:gustatory receptor for bitter taste 66a [Toxorhynchites rutilus septentrionalis]|uniref:gustatory receptor for bitter taste 66a n=1 Tax=Toxorhynchites rutilus septentrionalis TaxID=329112 RepID=UPI00247AD9C3|nr:gustatory receptor for bitter taste 66a [Toxorhynchites rutilus septentrionalis]
MAAKPSRMSLLESVKALFYTSSVLGVVPYSLREFYSKNVLKSSILANIWVVVNMCSYSVMFHLSTDYYISGDGSGQGTLTNAIGILINYMEPLMMCIDLVASMINQKTLIDCVSRLERVDLKLTSENIIVNNAGVRRYTNILLILAFIFEFLLTTYNFIVFAAEYTLLSLMWFITAFPTGINSVSRIWFFVLVSAVRHRFQAMNSHMDELAGLLEEHNERWEDEREFEKTAIPMNYLEKEIFTIRSHRRGIIHPVQPMKKGGTPKIINVLPIEKIGRGEKAISQKRSTFDFLSFEKYMKIDEKLDKKMILVCRMHDELCEIGKCVNQMFSFQMLVSMAHGFMVITAQFYFLYCALSGQPVPILFRTAQVVQISVLLIAYIAMKCVICIYVCWKTKTESKRTGVYMHHLANMVDETHFYQIVNHLSLKLLNHQLNFSACGFFDLDMTTLYAITGAITSYLIILIQFNLAALGKTGNSTEGLNVTSTAVPLLNLTSTISTALSTYVANP